MLLLILFLLFPYALVIIACSCVFVFRMSRLRKPEACESSPFSLVVCTSDADAAMCARGLPPLYASLRECDEVIIVADHVGAAGLAELRRAASVCGGAVAVVENERSRGKKNAQRCGVMMARRSAVVCVDADCSVGPGFADALGAVLSRFSGRHFMLLLPVAMCGSDSLFSRLVELEFGCLQVVTAGTAMLGRPSMANGAGMAFDKQLYTGHDACERYASGDDMFLLAHALRTGAVVRYLPSSAAVVSTVAPASLGAYLRQRTRWLAKAGGYTDAGVVLLALVVFAAVMAWPAAFGLAMSGFVSWGAALGVFVAKLLIDASACAAWLFFRCGLRGLASLWVALPLELLYPFMTVTVSFRALMADRARW